MYFIHYLFLVLLILHQLLQNPNPNSALRRNAGVTYQRFPKNFVKRCKEKVERYAK